MGLIDEIGDVNIINVFCMINQAKQVLNFIFLRITKFLSESLSTCVFLLNFEISLRAFLRHTANQQFDLPELKFLLTSSEFQFDHFYNARNRIPAKAETITVRRKFLSCNHKPNNHNSNFLS